MAQNRAIALYFQDTKQTFEIDCTDNLNVNRSADVTQYPVEKGSRTSDHRDRKPLAVSVTGQMSDVHYLRASEDPFAIDPFAPIAYDPEATGQHSKLAAALEAADLNNELITVMAGKRGTFADLLLVNFDVPADASQGSAYFFSLSFTHFDISETKVENLAFERSRQQELAFRKAQAEDDKRALALFGKGGGGAGLGVGVKIVAKPEDFQRWSPSAGRGLTPAQPAGSALMSQMADVVALPGGGR